MRVDRLQQILSYLPGSLEDWDVVNISPSFVGLNYNGEEENRGYYLVQIKDNGEILRWRYNCSEKDQK